MTLVSTNHPSFSSLFDEFFNTEMSDWKRNNYSTSNTTLPKVNIMEDEDGFGVEMAAPGMQKSDFNIKLDDNVLSISSERSNATTNKPTKNLTIILIVLLQYAGYYHIVKIIYV